MRSLVTGGAGFIGSHVARHCLAMGHEVIVLDDLSGGYADQVPGRAHFMHGSVCDSDLVSSLFERTKIDYIYHIAAYAAEGLSHYIRRFNYTNNLIGSVNLINQAVEHEVRCFVFTSSVAVYGSGQVPMEEEMTPLPEDPYGISEYAVELDLQAAHHMFGLNYIIFRPHNVYGEYQNIGDKYRNVIGIFMTQIMQGKPLTVFGDGTQTRAFSYIDDVAPHIARSAALKDAYNEVINIGADTPVTVLDIAHMIGETFGISPNIRHLPARDEVMHAYANHNKAKKLLDAPSTVDLQEGIARMARWARSTGARKSQSFHDIELRKNMPAVWLE